MSTYYEELQKKIDEYNKRLDSSFLELRSLYLSRRSWNIDNYKREEDKIKNDIDNLVNIINENKDLLATYSLVNYYTKNIKDLTKMYNEVTNSELKEEISNELLNKREFINNKLTTLPEDISKELRNNYIEETSKLEDKKVNELELEKTKILEELNTAKRKTENSKKNMLDIFNEERFIIENEGPFKTEKELDAFYEKYMSKKIKENKTLERNKKKQENLEKKLRLIEDKIQNRREIVSTANALNINPDDYENINNKVKKRNNVKTLTKTLKIKNSNLSEVNNYIDKPTLNKSREEVKKKLVEEKIQQRKRSKTKALPQQVDVKELLPVVDKSKENHLLVIDKLKEGLTNKKNNRNISTNLKVNNNFRKELHNRENLYNVIHVTPQVTKLPVSVVKQLSTNIINRDSAKEKLKIVKERLDNLNERELLILYKQYGKHNENERFSTGINILIRDRITKYVKDKEIQISKDLDERYAEIFNCVKELDTINVLMYDKETSKERKEELESYKATLIKGKAKTVLNIRKDYEDAKLLFNNGSDTINKNIKNRFLKNRDLDVEILDQEQRLIKAEFQAIKDSNDEMALRCFIEREKLLSKHNSKEININISKASNKNYYSPLAEKLDYKNDSLTRNIYKSIVEVGTNLNTKKLLNNNEKYYKTKKEILEITNNYSKGLISSSETINLLDKLNLNIKEETRLMEDKTIKKLEEYKNNNSSFNLDKTTNAINYLIDNPESLSSAKLKVIDSIPNSIKNDIVDTISTNTLTHTLNRVVKADNNKIKYTNKMDDILNNYIEYQKEEINKKTK